MNKSKQFHKPTPKEMSSRDSHSNKATQERQDFKLGKKMPSYKTTAGRKI
jgi:hypothetical protein